MGEVSCEIVDEPAVVELADEDVVVSCLCPSLHMLFFDDEGLAGEEVNV